MNEQIEEVHTGARPGRGKSSFEESPGHTIKVEDHQVKRSLPQCLSAVNGEKGAGCGSY